MTTVPTTENLRRIKEAYSSGVLRVQYADRVVWYRSLKEMQEIIFSLEAQLYPKKSSFKAVKIIEKKVTFRQQKKFKQLLAVRQIFENFLVL